MAGGIDWFRWHHGSVSDQKFILVAKRAGASVAEVIAVWACLLEAASASDDRGNFGAVDYESLDCALGMRDGLAQAIHEAMASRGVVTPGGQISAWEKRQPKREREGDNSTERVRAFRQSQRQETPGNATQHQETPRGEESREELKEPKTKTARKRAAPAVLVSLPELVAEGVEEQHATDWLVARKVKGLPLTPTAWDDIKAEAIKARMSPGEAIKAAACNGWGGFKAAWLQEPARNGPHLTHQDRKAAEMAKWFKGTSLDPDKQDYTDAPLALR